MFDKEHYLRVKEQLNGRAELCAVSKKHTCEEIQAAYDLGQRVFGENHAAELCTKAQQLPQDISWHFIGHLQRNKVKAVLPYVSCIQSLDSLRLAQVIEKEAAKIGKTVPCLLEFHLASEDTNKTGLLEEEAEPMLEECRKLEHLRIDGIMTMGPHTEDEAEIRRVFEQARGLYERLREKEEGIHILSMGMSDDYQTALACGSNMVRIGSYLFRNAEQD